MHKSILSDAEFVHIANGELMALHANRPLVETIFERTVVSPKGILFLPVGCSVSVPLQIALSPSSSNEAVDKLFSGLQLDKEDLLVKSSYKTAEDPTGQVGYAKALNLGVHHKLALRLFHRLTTTRQSSQVNVKSSPFLTDTPKLTRTGTTATFTFPLNRPSVPPDLQEILDEVPQSDYDEVKRDYLEHFPLLSTLMLNIVAARFADSSKAAWMHIQAPSDWGKTGFTEVLQDIGLAMQVEVSALVNAQAGRPSSFRPEQFVHSLCLVIEEAKDFNKSLFGMSDTLQISPKFESMVTVEIFSKLLLSADPLDKVTRNGVDPQVANRLSWWPQATDAQKINHRPVFLKHSAIYKAVTADVICKLANQLLDEFVSAGRIQAAQRASSILAVTRSTRSYGEFFETSEQRLPEFADVIRERLHDWANGHLRQSSNDRIITLSPAAQTIFNVHCRIVTQTESTFVKGKSVKHEQPFIYIANPDVFIAETIKEVLSGRETQLTYQGPSLLKLLAYVKPKKSSDSDDNRKDDVTRQRFMISPHQALIVRMKSELTVPKPSQFRGMLVRLKSDRLCPEMNSTHQMAEEF